METTYEIETRLLLPVTVEYVRDGIDVQILRITVKGVVGVVGDIPTPQYDAIVDEILA
jgi:hypothetical protein